MSRLAWSTSRSSPAGPNHGRSWPSSTPLAGAVDSALAGLTPTARGCGPRAEFGGRSTGQRDGGHDHQLPAATPAEPSPGQRVDPITNTRGQPTQGPNDEPPLCPAAGRARRKLMDMARIRRTPGASRLVQRRRRKLAGSSTRRAGDPPPGPAVEVLVISAQLVEVRVCRSEFRAHGRRAEPVECGQLRDEPCPRALRICGQNRTYDGCPLMAA